MSPSPGVFFARPLTLHHPYPSNDSPAELKLVQDYALSKGADQAVTSNHWARGGEGALPLAHAVIKACEGESEFKFLYDVNLPLEKKIEIIAKEMYGADGIELSEEARKQIETYTRQGEPGMMEICSPSLI